jgi:hypothetical protein
MSKKDAKTFFEILETDPTLQFEIVNSHNEAECIQVIHQHHLSFDEKEFRKAFEDKFHCTFSKDELHKLAAEGRISSPVAAKLPFTRNRPHHGE